MSDEIKAVQIFTLPVDADADEIVEKMFRQRRAERKRKLLKKHEIETAKRAREAFDESRKSQPISDWLVLRQKLLAEWQAKNFGKTTNAQIALGVAEETGELAHAVLKHSQGIREFADRDYFLAKAADALADIAVYSMNLCSRLGLDYGTLIREASANVLKRDWNKDKETGGEDR